MFVVRIFLARTVTGTSLPTQPTCHTDGSLPPRCRKAKPFVEAGLMASWTFLLEMMLNYTNTHCRVIFHPVYTKDPITLSIFCQYLGPKSALLRLREKESIKPNPLILLNIQIIISKCLILKWVRQHSLQRK